MLVSEKKTWSRKENMNIIDILFLVTVVLLVLHGLRYGALHSLISLLTLPIAFAVAYNLGPNFAISLASSGLKVTPLVSYAILFIGTILVLHVLGGFLRNIVKVLPLFGPFDALLGGVIGFVEAWLIWFILLMVFGTFLYNIQTGTNAFPNVDLSQFIQHYKDWNIPSWYQVYNDTVTHSLFAQVNDFFARTIPFIPQLPKLKSA
jgi:uncharacterized membrane protein required for colicin V production